MSTPKLESVMTAIVAAATAITDGGSPAKTIFNLVSRQILIPSNLPAAQRPAVGVQRLIDRNDRQNDTVNSQKTRLVFQLQIVGSQSDKSQIDTELVQLREYLDSKFLNATLGGLVSPITYFGADSSSFVAMPQGNELVTYECVFSKPKPDFPNG